MTDEKPKFGPADIANSRSLYLEYLQGKPQGYQLISRFIYAIENGKQPIDKDNQRLAEALKEILIADKHEDGLHAFARSLDLKGKQGKKRPPFKNTDEINIVLLVMFAERSGMSKTAAQNKVAAERFPYQRDALRHIKALYKKHEKDAHRICDGITSKATEPGEF